MNKRIFIVWGLLIALLVLGIGYIGITKKEEIKYISLKNEVKKATKEYINDNNIKVYPFKITTEKLEEKDYLKELKINNKVCAGDIVVNKKIIFYSYDIKFTCVNVEK